MTSSWLFHPCRQAAIGLALLFFLLGITSALALTEAGQIIALTGRVVATDANQAERELALRSPVYVGDRIQTTPGARAQVFLLDDTTVSLGEDSYMVIDEFVFEGKPQEDVSSLRFLRGVIRNVTGRITQANPSRFQVKTGKAVIGVRGCDILFDIQPELEQIHVLEVPSGRQIIVDADYRPRNRPDRHIQKRHEIKQSGRTVQLFDTGENRQLATPPNAIRGLMQRLGPAPKNDSEQPAGGTEYGDNTAPPPPPGSGAPDPGPANDLAGLSPDNPANPQSAMVDDIIVNRPISTDEVFVSPQQQSASPPTAKPSPDPNSNVDPNPQPEPNPGPGPTPDPDPGPGPFPDPGPLVKVIKASGTDWEWGIWETPLNHTPMSLYKFANTLPAITVANLRSAAIHYDLQGIGQAGAIIYEDGAQNIYIQGTVNFHITLGMGNVPAWDASYSLDNGANASLQFNSSGTIDSDQVMRGVASGYLLTVDGRNFASDTLVENRVDGQLVGNASLLDPITGVAGHFRFDRGVPGPKVDGAYGVDLSPTH